MEQRGREPGCFWKASVVPWFRGFCQPPHELQPELGRCLDPFWMPLFFPPPSVGMTRGQTMLGFPPPPVSRLLPSPASLEPNRSNWGVGNRNLTDIVPPLSTMESWPPGLPAEVTESCRRCSATTSFGQDAMRTLRALCGGGAFFFFRCGCLGRTSPPDAMPGAMARMRDEHITTPRDPNHLGRASLDAGPG